MPPIPELVPNDEPNKPPPAGAVVFPKRPPGLAAVLPNIEVPPARPPPKPP